MIIKYNIDEDDVGKVVKTVLKHKLNFSKNLLNTIKDKDWIYLNNKPICLYEKVKLYDSIRVEFKSDEENLGIEPEDNAIKILYEDDGLLVVDKEPGIIIHPTFSCNGGTLANYVAGYFAKNKIRRKIRPVNRLDRDTSGIVIFAKNQYIQHCLIQQMKLNQFKKEYIGIVNGHIGNNEACICERIRRCEDSIIKREVHKLGCESITHYRVIKKTKSASIVFFQLETGRTHQIRVHTSYIGNSLIADSLYGCKQDELIGRQALHAYKVEFIHPLTNKKIRCISKLPKDIRVLIKRLLNL